MQQDARDGLSDERRNEPGDLPGFGKVGHDLTARRQSEEEAEATTPALRSPDPELAEYRRLVSSVRDYAIFMLDPAGHVLSWNTGARHLKQYEPDEIIGRHFSVFYTAEDRLRDHPAEELLIAEREGRYEEEGWRIRKDGSSFWASVTITAVRDEEGRLTGFAKVTRDLTERRRNDEALRAAVDELRRVNAELDRFAMVAAHDMTDPLRTISGFAEILTQDDPGAAEGRQFAQHILDSSLRLTALLQGLLAYARAGGTPAESVPVDLAATVGQVRADLAMSVSERRARVEATVPEGAQVLMDGKDLRLVLQNLVANALKFADPQGPAISIDVTPRGDDWCISVLDNGRGIAPEHQARIFGAFERVPGDAAGHGLGLAICHRLVERHGGRIGVESAPDQGARFWFTLQAADRPASGSQAAADAA